MKDVNKFSTVQHMEKKWSSLNNLPCRGKDSIKSSIFLEVTKQKSTVSMLTDVISFKPWQV